MAGIDLRKYKKETVEDNNGTFNEQNCLERVFEFWPCTKHGVHAMRIWEKDEKRYGEGARMRSILGQIPVLESEVALLPLAP